MPAGRPSTLTDELIQRVGDLADVGLPGPVIAARLGIPPSTWGRWMKIARAGDSNTKEARLLEVIDKGASELTERYLNSLHNQAELGNVNAITWLLTHNRLTREHWSDAAAERRTERRTVATVLEAVAATGLTPDQERTLLLQLQARGLGAQGQGQEGEG